MRNGGLCLLAFVVCAAGTAVGNLLVDMYEKANPQPIIENQAHELLPFDFRFKEPAPDDGGRNQEMTLP